MESAAQAGMYNQPQGNFYPQSQFVAPMGFNPEYSEMGMNCGAVENSEPTLSQLSQTAKPFIPSFMGKPQQFVPN